MIQSIQYQNHQIKYFTEGSGETILFLHGWPTNSKIWQAQVERLKSQYKTVTLDWLGFGASDKPSKHHYTFTAKKEILNALLSGVLKKDENLTIVAHDIGGPPAIMWASENEAKVKRLILLNTVIYTFKTKTDGLSEILFNTPLIKDGLLSQTGLRFLMKSNIRNRNTEIHESIENILEAYQDVNNNFKRKTIHEPLRAGRKNELLLLSEQFKNLRSKKHLIIAEKDPLCFKHIKRLSMENPDVPVYNIQNCGHYLSIDQPQVLNKILIDILKEKEES